MRICIIVDDYLPDSIKVSAKMMHELACEFVERGNEVTVITPSVTVRENFEKSFLDGVAVYRFKSGEIKNIGKIKRAINETLLSFRAWKNLRSFFVNNPHDYIIYYSPSIFWGDLVSKLKKLWNAPAYLILRDFFPQWAIDQGLIKQGSLIEKYFRYFEKRCYAPADTIGVMSQRNLEWFVHKYQINKHVEVLPNWAADNPVPLKRDYKKELGLSDKIVYFYGGNMGYAQDMMNLVRLAKNMQNISRAHFVLVGKGDEYQLVENAIKKLNLQNVTLLPAVNQDEYKQMLASFDVGLFTLHKDHNTHNFPGKLLGYMVQQMPILGSINSGNDLKEVIKLAGAGFVTVNGEDDKFLENAKKLLNEELREIMGKNAKKLLQSTFSIEAATNKLLNAYSRNCEIKTSHN